MLFNDKRFAFKTAQAVNAPIMLTKRDMETVVKGTITFLDQNTAVIYKNRLNVKIKYLVFRSPAL